MRGTITSTAELPNMRSRVTAFIVSLITLAAVVPVSAAEHQPAAPAPQAEAAISAGQLDLQLVVGGLSQPVGVVNAGDGTGRLFVVQQSGTVRVVQGNRLLSGNFLNVGSFSSLSTGGERGLLGLAFHPNFESNRKLFVYFTNAGGDIVIAELTANAAKTAVLSSSYDPILTIEHSSQSNHNGGQLLFGPDGYLYVFTGDGGGGGDPGENAQDPTELLGKVLRIAPNLSGGFSNPTNPFGGSVWDIGLRNPWRASFDRATDRLWIADVGQGSYEEINRENAATGGRNYGWDCREGLHAYSDPSPGISCSGKTFTSPIAEYQTHAGGNCAVTGGYVYRGSIQKDFVGTYVLGDYCSGRLWSISAGGSTLVFQRDTAALITSFGEAENGEIYMTDHGGRLYRVIAPPFSDIKNSSFFGDILWLYYEGITGGCGGGRFCPDGTVTREQMASFLARALHLPTTSKDFFSDDNSSPHEGDINRVAAAGITGGCDTNRYCPRSTVTRAQMASFLVRAFHLSATTTDFFDDDDRSIHEGSINALAKSGITGGCDTRRYCPSANVTRGQMAAFLKRALD
jgi:glucose/arabinose dehydrogenase